MAGNMKDFATGIVSTAPSPAISGTSLVLQTGQGDRMPTVPFFAVAHSTSEMPTLDNAEKILVTNVTGDVLTIVRAQGETTAKSIAVGWRLSNALFKSDIDSLELPETPTNPTIKYLNGDKQWAEITVGSGGYAANIYPTTITSTIVGTYKQISYSHETSETINSITCNNNEVLGYTYLFEQPVGITSIDAGSWKFVTNCAIDAAAGDTWFKFEVFSRTVGGSESVLFSSYSQTIENRTGYEGYLNITTESIQPIITVNSTDRLGLRIYAKTTAAGSRTLYFKVGDGNAAYINTPLAIRHSQLRGVNDDSNVQHLTSAQVSALHPQLTGGTPSITLGTSNIAGSSPNFLRRDDTILAFDSNTPSAETINSTAAVGTATVAARRDHVHDMPSAIEILNGIGCGYASCSTDIVTDTKTVTLPGYSLTPGGIVGILFINGISTNSATLNINSTGAKPIVISGSSVLSASPNSLFLFEYDGTSYNIINSYIFDSMTANSILGKTDLDSGTVFGMQITNGNPSFNIFSTTEKIIGKYIDGKDLYSRWKSVGITTSSQVVETIKMSNYSSVWVNVQFTKGKTRAILSNYYWNGTDMNRVYVEGDGKIYWQGGSSYPALPAVCTYELRYTKP